MNRLTTENWDEAQALADIRAYEASAGILPGKATFEQIVDALVHDLQVRGRKVARAARAARALKAKLAGHRAEVCDYSIWLKYVVDRETEVSRDTIHFELAIARAAYRLARKKGLIANVPEFPPIDKLHVRQGFVDAAQWADLREYLSADFRDAADFAWFCGARQMETLSLTWAEVERDAGVINLHKTKTGKPRVIPYAALPELAEIIERRAAISDRLQHAGVLSRWVFCFEKVGVRRPAGSPLFERTERKSGERGLCKSLRKEWRAAAVAAGRPGLLFHDLRRSAARNLERAGVSRSIAMKLGGWSDAIYSRYAIAAEREIGPALRQLGDYLRQKKWHSSGTRGNTQLNRGDC
jgi:integrase